jgi:hypothetical protein
MLSCFAFRLAFLGSVFILIYTATSSHALGILPTCKEYPTRTFLFSFFGTVISWCNGVLYLSYVEWIVDQSKFGMVQFSGHSELER